MGLEQTGFPAGLAEQSLSTLSRDLSKIIPLKGAALCDFQ